MALPVVAIVGRPNVGKSSLLNALARERISIVDPRAGITRDRVSVLIEHAERYFELIDTGGIGLIDDDHLEDHVEQQIRHAIAAAELIVFLVDVREGVLPLDVTVAERLRRLEKPVVLAANKVDVEALETEAAVFEQLGFGPALPVSANAGRGRVALLEEILARLGSRADAQPAVPHMRLAIVGKRNAGKSSFVNALAGEERVIVSETPGTTRDAVDVRFERDGQTFVAIDTAGVRKKRRMQDVEFYSYQRALQSIRRADVVLHLIDATVPVSEVDLKLARAVQDELKPAVLGVNKWDLAQDRATAEAYGRYLGEVMPLLDYAPISFITATTGRNVGATVEVALGLFRQAQTRVSTGRLNQALETLQQMRAPTPRRGTRPLKLYYATQAAVAPPTLVFFCNYPELVSENYRRFVENRLRELLPFQEVPMRLLFRPHHERKARAVRAIRPGRR